MASAHALVDSDIDDIDTADKDLMAGAHNSTSQDMPPRFSKLDKMHRIVVKPAGNMMRLKCPAEGEFELINLVLTNHKCRHTHSNSFRFWHTTF